MKKKLKAGVVSILAGACIISSVAVVPKADASTRLSVSTKKVTLMPGKSKSVKANKKVSWTTSNKKIATVKKMSSKKAMIKAVKNGSCKVTAKSGKTKVVIQVTVKNTTTITTSSPVATITPTATPVTTEPKEAETPQPVNTLTPEEKQELDNAISEPMPGEKVTQDNETSAIYSVSAAGITVSAVSNTAENIQLSIKNDNDDMAIFGRNYKLQKLENKTWVSVPYIVENPAFTLEGIMVEGHSVVKWNENWKTLHGELGKGTYRIIKDFHVAGNCYNIACEFEITE